MTQVVMESFANIDGNGNQEIKGSESAENFQKFMYELLEKNGVMNDLRSYLRGHIVNVLRNAQTGDPPPCQKHFTQRLDLKFQALNILIAEYLLCLEFGYTLSVFISEIPLANMVFSYAKTLMGKLDNDDSKPRFKDNDVWCILNYLGVKCDSEHASSIVEMYRLDRNRPLLLCILKSASLCKEPLVTGQGVTSQDSLSSSANSSESDSVKQPLAQEKCRHYVFCKACQSKMARIKEKYSKKKKDIAKKLKEASVNSLNVDSLMKNINVMERSLIDEMFEQLKSVYESEMEFVKQDEDKRVKRSLAVHSTQLQKRREEMEQSFKDREMELEHSVQQKKRFLWGLARSLREQHQHMTRAMHDIKDETNRLTAKEDSLKTQLAEAEQILRERGEDMRRQISNELAILEKHLESMKMERDSINRERSLLEQYKDKTTASTIESVNLKSHYELLRNEFGILKKYLETAKLQPKCVIERSTLTDLCDVTSRIDVVLNNGQDVDRVEERVKPKQLLNDLKKQKNVNFSQSNLDEIYRERSQSRSRSSASSEAGDAVFDTDRDTMKRLREENAHLRCFARQQREHIDNLTNQQARVQAELTASRLRMHPTPMRSAPPPVIRPRTAPATVFSTLPAHTQRLNTSASMNNFEQGWKKGAGEEMSFFTNAQPRILVPGDTIPFVGVLTRHNDNRRYLINQWRALRRRISPLGGVCKPRAGSPEPRSRDRIAEPGIRLNLEQDGAIDFSNHEANGAEDEAHSSTRPYRAANTKREKSPKSVLREAKEKLKAQACFKSCPPTTRDKSPNSVLREAKLRLRKLEIEAEAVENSYLDFRRKQDAFRNERSLLNVDNKGNLVRNDIDSKPNTSTYRRDETYTKESTSQYEDAKSSANYEKYIKNFETTYNIGETFFKNKNTAAFRIKPIPNEYSVETKKRDNYLDTPLNEFRKFYHPPNYSNTPKSAEPPESTNKGSRKQTLRQVKHDKVKELELLKQNIGKIYNMPDQAIFDTPVENKSDLDIEWKESDNYLESQENNCINVEYENSAQGDAILEEDVINIESHVVEMVKSDFNENHSVHNTEDRNLLKIEVESISEINDVKVTESQTQDLVVVVKSSEYSNRDADMSDYEFDKENIPTQMTIIVSPKKSIKNNELQEIVKSPCDNALEGTKSRGGNFSSRNRRDSEFHKSSPIHQEHSTKSELVKSELKSNEFNESVKSQTTRNILAVYHTENDRLCSMQMKIDISKDVLDNTISELEQNEDPDYPDDFSADVDNYNNRSDYNNSPISLNKTSEEDNFWGS